MDVRAERGRSLPERLEEFEQIFQEEDPWRFLTSSYEQARHRLTLGLVPPQRLVLEVGCAEGVFTEMLATRSKRVIAFDFSRAAIGRARQRCARQANVSLVLTDLVTAEFAAVFDVVIATEVLGYLEEWRTPSLLAKMARWLHPGGLLITNPAHGGLSDWLRCLRGAALTPADARHVSVEGQECWVFAAERNRT